MTVTRRGFLTGMLALGAAPAIVRAESLMRLWVPPQDIWTLDDRYYRGNVDELPFYAIMHPSMAQMLNEMMHTGTGIGSVQVIFTGNVGALRHG